jgi:hypothetical protein
VKTIEKSKANKALEKLLKDGSVLDHSLCEVDGNPVRIDKLMATDIKGKLIRISKHLYLDGQGLTEGAPDWKSLWD